MSNGALPKLLFLTVMPSPYQRQLFARMASSGRLDVRVLYYAAGAPDRKWQESKLHPYETVLTGSTLKMLGDSAHWNPGVLAEVRRASPDLVIISDYSAPTAQVAMRSLAAHGMPFVFWGEVPGFSQRGAIGKWIRRRLQGPLSRARAIAAIGDGAVQAYGRLFPELPVFNIPYYCDLDPYRAAAGQNAKKVESDEVVILFSGQLIERKGVDLLLKAFESAGTADSRLRLHIVGDGPERASLEAAVGSDMTGRVRFLGHQEPSMLPDLFAAADIFCLPSRHDGWGVVVNEALGAGLPIVVSASVGAGRDIVSEGINGFVTRTGNVDDLVQALTALSNDDVRRQMAAQSALASRKWDLDQGVIRWCELTNEVLQTQRLR